MRRRPAPPVRRGGAGRSTPSAARLVFVVPLLVMLLVSARAHAQPRLFIITSDGLGDMPGRLLIPSWVDTAGAYFPNTHVGSNSALTIPSTAEICAAGGPIVTRCSNFPPPGDNGLSMWPYNYEIYRKEMAAPATSCVIVSGKSYLLMFNRCSTHPEYGYDYAPTRILVTTQQPEARLFTDADDAALSRDIAAAKMESHAHTGSQCSLIVEGPDSAIVEAMIAFIDTADVHLGVLNLSWGDNERHYMLACADSNWAAWYVAARRTFRTQERLIINRFIPFLQSHWRYRGTTTVIWTADHAFGIPEAHGGSIITHGHEWAPDSTSCLPACAGCDDSFLIAVGPKVTKGYYSEEDITLADVGATTCEILGLVDPYPTGNAITEILNPTRVEIEEQPPTPFAVGSKIDTYDVSGRFVFSAEGDRIEWPRGLAQGMYLMRVSPPGGRPYYVKATLVR